MKFYSALLYRDGSRSMYGNISQNLSRQRKKMQERLTTPFKTMSDSLSSEG